MESAILEMLQWKWPVVVGLAICIFALSTSKRRLPVPPGPTGLPVVGNLLQIPQAVPWIVYNDWAKRYGQYTPQYLHLVLGQTVFTGDIMYVNALGQGIVVLNSLSAARAVMETRALNNSDRGSLPSFDIMDFNWALGVMQYGPNWRAHRRAFHQFLNQNQVAKYLPVIEQECLVYLRNLANSSNTLFKHSRTYMGTVIMRVAYGVSDTENIMRLIDDAEGIVERFSVTSVPGNLLVNVFPILRHVPDWFPGTAWKKYLKEGAVINKRLVPQPYYQAKDRLRDGLSAEKFPSMIQGLIGRLGSETDTEYGEGERVAMNVCAQSYLAGVETSYSATIAFFAALVMHPEAQRKAQAEIDAVTGGNRLPTAEDMADLPYIDAIIKETTRWFTAVPLGVPHQSREEQKFNGYFIPKKTLIMANSWAILHDPDVFEDPFDFIPERYLKDGKIDPSVLDPEVAAFGFGRRICPGRHLSSVILKFTLASVLAVCDVRLAKDEHGKEIPVTFGQDTFGLVTSFKPFTCDIVPRSTKHATWLA
ncbi:O-methylsterigmatocystin oxidoreductase [Coprinopsis marcescibilis]|uniref:O-methylsterigmatocystin oxidoreductase n=1 Tax=Coprinopsis marcescibilis TaxID=230819 RepID=A0A5C3KTQ1_COPMA|nr:O-methylsterigmatocystin oxidoreductase [Coprinopsis marcescibilis]